MIKKYIMLLCIVVGFTQFSCTKDDQMSLSPSKELLLQVIESKDVDSELSALNKWLELPARSRSITLLRSDLEDGGQTIEISFPSGEDSISRTPIDQENAKLLFLE